MRTTLLLLSLSSLLPMSCTSPETVRNRQAGMSNSYAERQSARAERVKGRDDRDRMWRNRVMGKPIDDPGLPDFH